MSEDLGPSLRRYIEARYATEEAWQIAQEARGGEDSGLQAQRSILWQEYHQHLRDTEREFLDTAWRVATAGARDKDSR